MHCLSPQQASTDSEHQKGIFTKEVSHIMDNKKIGTYHYYKTTLEYSYHLICHTYYKLNYLIKF